ncbi:unnamed protein product [Triticum turgidum subsp. durum]|uniref:Uncharacterized protein n=1 Tax=Triticum turgidum subsp. durum TaxID=4567 RepID=A0A9R0VLX5_TRITD|nr:unnamed protein product [Triticum turgidum subsp. durum]
MVAPACSCKKRREDEGEGERKPGGRRETRGGTAWSCAAGFSGEEQIGRGRSREWAAFGDRGAGRGARGASSQGEMDEDEDGLVRCCVSHIVAETRHGGLPLEEMQMLQLHQRFYVGVLCVGGSSSQGLAPWTGESSQPSWTHQGQGLHAAKSEATAKKTRLDVVTEEAHAAGYALLISMMICICTNATPNGFANNLHIFVLNVDIQPFLLINL